MKNLIFFIIYFLLLSISFAQKKPLEHYSYPLDNSYNPITIRANMIVLYRNDGTGNFDFEDEEQKVTFDRYLNYINEYFYPQLVKPEDLTGCYTGTDFMPDMKIRVTYNIIKVKNDYYWNYLNSGSNLEENKKSGFSPTENWYIKELDDSISNAANIPKGINVYLTGHGTRFDRIHNDKGMSYDLVERAAGQFPTTTNLRRSSQVHLPNRYLKYLWHRNKLPIDHNITWKETLWWHLADGKVLAHEFGHNFGLSHSNEYHAANTCIYSIMSQTGGDPHNYLQPTEIKKIHWNLTRTNMMQFVTEDSHYGVTWQIEKDTIWDKPRRFYNDFEIAKNVTLTVSDSIVLPTNSKIKLNEKSKIKFIGNGKIVDAFGKEFINFEKQRSAKIEFL